MLKQFAQNGAALTAQTEKDSKALKSVSYILLLLKCMLTHGSQRKKCLFSILGVAVSANIVTNEPGIYCVKL